MTGYCAMADSNKLRDAIRDARKTWHLGTTGHVLIKTICDAAESTLPQAKDHVIVCRHQSTGGVEFWKSNGEPLMTKEDAMERARKWSLDYPGSTYTVVDVSR